VPWVLRKSSRRVGFLCWSSERWDRPICVPCSMPLGRGLECADCVQSTKLSPRRQQQHQNLSQNTVLISVPPISLPSHICTGRNPRGLRKHGSRCFSVPLCHGGSTACSPGAAAGRALGSLLPPLLPCNREHKQHFPSLGCG